jgi:hypothetical protein
MRDMPALSTHTLSSTPDATANRLSIVTTSHPARAEVERFITRIYRERYGAEVARLAPVLVARRDAGGVLVAAAGFRPGESGAFFLERYLSRPADDLLGAPRSQIVEVGHLASDRAGEGRKLVLQLAPLLASHGFRWVVSTLTEELRHLFLRLGIAPQALGVASPALLGDEAACWGSYYEHHPVVLAGAIEPAMQALSRRRSAE